MKECIERDAVHDAVSKLKRLAWQSSTTIPNAESCVAVELDAVHAAVENIPAADVRPMVLCRDCLHYEMGACLKIYDDGAANKDAWQERKPEDFCSYGEKRKGS